MSCDTINGRDLVAFFEPQTGGLGTIAEAWPVGGSVKAVRMNTVQCNPDNPTGAPPRWMTGSRTKLGDLPRQVGFTVSMEHYPYGVASSLTERDWEILFTSGGYKSLVGPAATTITTGASATNLPLTSLSGLSQFMTAVVEVAGRLEPRLISVVNGSDVDIFPRLPSAPADGSDVTFGRTLQIDDDWCPADDCLSAWFFNGTAMLHRVTGLVQEQADWGGSADAEVVVNHSGKAYRIERIFATALDADIADGVVTSMDVVRANCVPDDINVARTVYFQIGDEVIGVTASDGAGTLTITRGEFSTTAAAHSAGDPVVLYVPTPTYSGIDPTGVNSGGFSAYVDGTEVEGLCVSSFSTEVNNGVTFAGCFGDDYAIGQAAASAPTTVNMTGSAWARTTSTLPVANYGDSRTPVTIHAKTGKALGKLMSALTPNLVPNNPPLSLADEIVSVDITGEAIGDETLGTTNPPGAETALFFLLG